MSSIDPSGSSSDLGSSASSGPTSSASSGSKSSSISGPEGAASSAPGSSLRQPQRLHVLTLFYRLLMSLPGYLLILYGGFGPDEGSTWSTIIFLVIYGLFTVPWAVVYYLRFRYQIDPDHVTIVQGILTRQDRSLPTERIQNVEIQQNLLQRFLGIARVRLETAGSHSVDGSLEYVAIDRAHEIRRVIRRYQRADSVGGERDSGIDETPDESPGDSAESSADVSADPSKDTSIGERPAAERARAEDDRAGDRDVPPTGPREGRRGSESSVEGELLYEMGLRKVLLRGTFRFSLLYIVLFFSAIEYLNLDLEQWLTQRGLEPVWTTVSQSPVLAATATFVVAVLLGWVTGILLTINRYYDFELQLEGDKLHEYRGLFTVTRGTIPVDKLQAYLLRSNVLMQAFGWYTLEVQAMGLESEYQGRRVAAPLIGLDEAEALLSRFRPVSLEDGYAHVSPLTIRRKLVRYTVGLGVLVALGYGLWSPDAIWGLVLWPPLALFALLQYRQHRYRYDADRGIFLVRSGVLRHRIWIVPIESVQVLSETRSIFQRRLDLGSLEIDTAGGPESNYPRVVDLTRPDADELMEHLYGQFQAAARPDPASEAA